VARKSFKGADAYEEVRPQEADLGVLAYVTQIIPLAMVDAPRFGSVCFHPSLLPRYRGGSAIPWQLINGETIGGVTLFRPDEGIDSGPIYLRRELEIGPDESAGSYYYGTVFEAGVDATLECVERVLDGTVEVLVQDESQATYDPLCRDEHAAIDWTRTARELHNLIRGCDPSPGAHATYAGVRLRVYGSRRGAATDAEPGTVLAVGEEGVEIAAGDASVIVAKMAFDAGKKPAAQAAREADLQVGARLGNAE
jgi:methionyl-tRNA formyltransferase